jgi:glucose-6-phosphate 1-dehydrogenase
MLDVETTTVNNPLREGLTGSRTVQPCIMVIFGATGDLTQRKLLPALYSLAADQPPLPGSFTVVGVARRPWTDEMFRSYVEEGIKEHARQPYSPQLWETFSKGIHYVQCDFDDTPLITIWVTCSTNWKRSAAPEAIASSIWQRRQIIMTTLSHAWVRQVSPNLPQVMEKAGAG